MRTLCGFGLSFTGARRTLAEFILSEALGLRIEALAMTLEP
jgi:hypothetical protein